MKMFLGTKKDKKVDQSTFIVRLTKCVTSLISIIEQENNLLEKGAISNLEAVILKKVAGLKEFNDIEHDLKEFARTNEIDRADGALLKLKELFARMEELNRQNEILLRTNIEVSDKIVEIYKNSRTQDTIRKFGYDSQGSVTATKNLEKVMPSISLNNKV
jgi:flagellar biosynthesis/type III secretory pathway chaperone